MSTSLPVLRLDRKDFSDAHFFGLDPLLITSGLDKDWPAMRKWSPAALREMNLQNEVNLNVSQNGSFRLNVDGSPFDATNHNMMEKVPFSKAIDAILEAPTDGPKYYISQQNITKKLPELLPDIQIWHRTLVAGPNLWFGSAGVGTQLHYDEGINIFAQIYGVKKFVVYPPGESYNLYPHPDGSPLSQIDFNNPDLEAFPRFSEAQNLVITVDPGWILLLPPFWWHYVEAQSTSISVNEWFAPALHQLIGPEALKWSVGEFINDRWRRYKSSKRLSRDDLTSSSLTVCVEHPEIALMAAISALDEIDEIYRTPRSQKLVAYLEAIVTPALKPTPERVPYSRELETQLKLAASIISAAS
jgi:lysine-specific demethylase 8